MFQKQKSLEVLVASMRHKIKIENTCIDAEFFYDLRLGVRISFKFHFAEGPEIIMLPRPTGLETSARLFQSGDWVYVKWWDSYPCKLSGEDHSKS